MGITEPKMVSDARKTGRSRSIPSEIGIFLLNMLIVMVVTSILITIPSAIAVLTSEELRLAMECFWNFDIEGAMLILDGLEEPWWLTAASLMLCAVEILTAVIYCTCIEKRSITTMGVTRTHIFGEYFSGFFVGAIMFAAVIGFNLLLGGASFEGVSLTAAAVPMIIVMLLGFIIQGAGEEFLFRGYLLVSMARREKMAAAIFWSSFIFGIMHVMNPGISVIAMINLILFGVFAAIYFLKRGNIWGVCAMHSAWNFVQGNVFGLPVSGTNAEGSVFEFSLVKEKAVISGGDFGPEGGLVTTVVLLIAIGVVLCLRNKDLGQTEEAAD